VKPPQDTSLPHRRIPPRGRPPRPPLSPAPALPIPALPIPRSGRLGSGPRSHSNASAHSDTPVRAQGGDAGRGCPKRVSTLPPLMRMRRYRKPGLRNSDRPGRLVNRAKPTHFGVRCVPGRGNRPTHPPRGPVCICRPRHDLACGRPSRRGRERAPLDEVARCWTWWWCQSCFA
jgi:hypothetical protein